MEEFVLYVLYQTLPIIVNYADEGHLRPKLVAINIMNILLC